MKLLRTFMCTKWEENKGKALENYGTDAFTKCTKTTGNTLSVWSSASFDFESTEAKDLIVAFATSMDRPDSIDLIWLDEDELQEKGLSFEQTPGETKFIKMRDRHVNIAELTYEKLGYVGEHIVSQMKNEDNYCRVTKNQLISMVVEASEKNDDFDLSSLKPGWAKHIEKYLAKRAA
ncbi:TPA: hypothetical protein RQJ54_003710 [Vibrio vulnificus]|uniref:hypothetical protein n=1 Tax=Vibrio vulnificus TaxID=672 RepID=UPI001592E41F|nr:hypothetical protein [Vibrio vulnificus]EID4390596.1 hypothetical protein [Vibrio vulnificus]NVC69938.1 hypothetical protein [Vibrio vulnificus]HDY7525780.1 hypothetical protein [Vibrio vulnificus]